MTNRKPLYINGAQITQLGSSDALDAKVAGFTAKAVPYADSSGVLQSGNVAYDATNNSFGVGTANPLATVHVREYTVGPIVLFEGPSGASAVGEFDWAFGSGTPADYKWGLGALPGAWYIYNYVQAYAGNNPFPLFCDTSGATWFGKYTGGLNGNGDIDVAGRIHTDKQIELLETTVSNPTTTDAAALYVKANGVGNGLWLRYRSASNTWIDVKLGGI